MATATRLLLFQPRTSSGGALAFSLLEGRAASGLQDLLDEAFKDHVTAATVEVFEQDLLTGVFEGPTGELRAAPLGLPVSTKLGLAD